MFIRGTDWLTNHTQSMSYCHFEAKIEKEVKLFRELSFRFCLVLKSEAVFWRKGQNLKHGSPIAALPQLLHLASAHNKLLFVKNSIGLYVYNADMSVWHLLYQTDKLLKAILLTTTSGIYACFLLKPPNPLHSWTSLSPSFLVFHWP